MKKSYNYILKLLFLVIIFLGINHLALSYLNNQIFQIGVTIMSSLILTFMIVAIQKKDGLKEIMRYLTNINNIDFILPDNVDIPDEEKEMIHNIARKIKTNLKTQVEISTEIFTECEQLNILSMESLSSAELIASSVDIADSNTSDQSDMLNNTNHLTNQINKSMYDIEKDIVEKIQFIVNSITSAQKGIETIDDIEIRMKNSQVMVEETSERMEKLQEYSNEVGGLVGLIHSISNETKMLSLNASIEAARAGEEGKGFSIVAMEVGKLAEETDRVSKKIEEVINVLRDEIKLMAGSMRDETKYMDENCMVIESTNKELVSIVETLNLGKESLEEIKDVTGQNHSMVEEITINIDKITRFSEETRLQMVETSKQTIEQHRRAKSLNQAVDKIRDNVYDMQQFVVGKVMEERMLKQAYLVRDYFKNNSNINDSQISQLLKDTGVDAIYITDPSGVVTHTNEKSALGLNLYIADPSFLEFKEKKRKHIVTPIKKRVEDGRLFKFLIIPDEEGRLYEVGLGLDSLVKGI